MSAPKSRKGFRNRAEIAGKKEVRVKRPPKTMDQDKVARAVHKVMGPPKTLREAVEKGIADADNR